MELIHENIEYHQNLPVKMFLHSVQLIQSHWHDSLEILFLLEGDVDLFINGEHITLGKADLAVLPPATIHAISSDTRNIMLALQISPDFINRYGGQNYSFFNLSPKNRDDRNAPRIRSIMARMMALYSKSGSGFELRLNALALELLYILVRFHDQSGTQPLPQTQKYLERMQHIVDYIHANFQTPITLSTLQELEHFSTAYISKFFHRYMGVSFITYLNSVRLQYAERALLESDISITQLALDSGFPNQKAFFKAFKEVYHETPKSYRDKRSAIKRKTPQGFHYFTVDEERTLETLFSYILAENQDTPIVKGERREFTVNTQAKTQTTRHTWKTLTTVARAKELLFAPVQEQLIILQQTVGFQYIRFHGIFDDAMMVYDEDRTGQPHYCFTYVDQIFDFLSRIGLRPFVELSFMPHKMAAEDKRLFYTSVCTAMPRRIQDWNSMVQAFIRHCIQRFGVGEVSQWYFEVWNEPDLQGTFWHGSWTDYLDFYRATYETVKALLPNARIGGPAVVNIQCSPAKKIISFLEYTRKTNSIPDFISFHSYPMNMDISSDTSGIGNYFQHVDFKSYNFELPGRTDTLAATITEVRAVTGNIPLFVTEYNGDAWARNLCHDTLYQAAFLVKNTLGTLDTVEGLGYWTLSDCMEEIHLGQDPFFGNFGLFTVQGIPKPGVAAFGLLSKLENEILSQGEGWIVTKKEDSYQILLYNYCHFDHLFQTRDTSCISRTNRYEVFQDKIIDFYITIENLEKSIYRQKAQLLSREHGSAFDAWVKLGAPESLTADDLAYLKIMSVPQQTGTLASCNNGTLEISWALHPHEICLITLQ